MAATAYGNAAAKAFNKEVDWNDGNVKVALVTSAYTFNKDTHDYFDDITGEVTGTGYTAGGAALVNPTATYDAATDKVILDADDLTWSTATITARGAVVYYNTGVATTSPVLCFVDFTTDKTSTAGDFKIAWGAGGILTITA